MDDAALTRYARHILLDEVGIEGQQRIRQGRVLIVGLGGLGCPAAQYLASAGVGELHLVDHDTVDASNLQRQILYRAADLGQPKARAAAAFLHQLNPDVLIHAYPEKATLDRLHTLCAQVDVVLDCSDNFATRHAINQACVQHRVPLVSGAAVRFSGQLTVFDARQTQAPCYHCLFPGGDEVTEVADMRCATLGVFAPLVAIIGAAQAAEALKLLAPCGAPSLGRLHLFDALRQEWQTIRYAQDPACAVCQPDAARRSSARSAS
ncbi:HesA/MoeB/ThiF family protein [Parvibium lacunae]|uniref:HesA/MoeB/ThiF family protein n=1 Tax=Parvibium lacunae TaxID=1888893 RepID=A0A368L0I8_9BURK|nr:HesA/MoeB/ThiF family protein [Parvibium lacunae]RCS57073.1 HesA/MoeB/ThiF family protein [Parvibium lacunae]